MLDHLVDDRDDDPVHGVCPEVGDPWGAQHARERVCRVGRAALCKRHDETLVD